MFDAADVFGGIETDLEKVDNAHLAKVKIRWLSW